MNERVTGVACVPRPTGVKIKRSVMVKIISIANLFLALCNFALIIIYEKLLLSYDALYRSGNANEAITDQIGSSVFKLPLLILLISIVSLIIGFVSLQEKMCNKILVVVTLAICSIDFLFFFLDTFR